MSIEEIMSQSPTPRTHSIWNSLVNAGSNPVETGRILGAARKMELELKAANERIKLLEEAGNAMDDYILDQTKTRFIICAIQWRKAKETKQ